MPIRVSHPSEGVVQLLIDNGPRNFTTAPLHEELERCLVEARDSGSRVVVIGSAVPGYFIGHGDIGDIVNNLTGGDLTGDPRAFLRLMRELDTGPMVSLAAIEGQTWGGGFLLALSCDFRAASRSSTFGQPEIMAGVTTAGEAVRISRMAGEAAARRLLLDGRPIDGSEAHRLGLVDRLAAEGSVLAEAITWAEWLTQRPAGDLARVKRGLLAGRDLPMSEALKAETARFVECFADPTIVARLTEVQRRYDAGADSYDAFGIPRTRQPHESS